MLQSHKHSCTAPCNCKRLSSDHTFECLSVELGSSVQYCANDANKSSLATMLMQRNLPLHQVVSSGDDQCALCRQVIQGLLDVLESKCRAVDSATAASCAACLVQLTHLLWDAGASLTASSAPSDFRELLAEGSRQCCALCIACACQQVQALNLRLATSDLFQPTHPASGRLPSKMTCKSRGGQQLHAITAPKHVQQCSRLYVETIIQSYVVQLRSAICACPEPRASAVCRAGLSSGRQQPGGLPDSSAAHLPCLHQAAVCCPAGAPHLRCVGHLLCLFRGLHPVLRAAQHHLPPSSNPSLSSG